MSDPKKVALFVNVENVYLGLRNMYNRELDPELLVSKAKARGELVKALAYADWKELPDGLADKFKPFGFETIQVDRVVHSRELGGKRREVVKDMVPVEMLAGVVATLLEGPDIGTVFIASGDKSLVPAARVAREKLSRDVVVCAIPGSVAKELETAAVAMDLIEVPPLEPVDEVGLSKLVPLMEELERRKRYLNFKYIRESVVRHGELKAKTFDEAERLLSDAIACGLVLKQKVEDKYHPGQLFTAYALNRDSALWKKYGNGLPAPVRLEGEDGDIREGAGAPAEGAPIDTGLPATAPASVGSGDDEPDREDAAPGEVSDLAAVVGATSAGPAPAIPMFTASSERADRGSDARPEGRGEGEGRDRRGRRGRRGRGDRGGDPARQGGERSEPVRSGADRPERGEPRGESRSDRGDRGRDRGDRGDRGRRGERGRGQPSRSGAGPSDKRGRGPRDGSRSGGRDQGRRFDAPARVREPITPVLNDDEVDEERILRARGDLGARGPE